MKKHITHKIKILLCASILFCSTQNKCNYYSPKLTVIIIVDQLAHHYFDKLSPYLRYGFRYLLDNGIVYTNAYYPHGKAATATGHVGLNTGTFANDHGIIGNAWYNKEGKKIHCDDDESQNIAVLSPNGTYDYGKSPHFIMVDGLSEQCALQSRPGNNFHVYALSYKSRSAISNANKLGKAIWFDEKTGNFTSSKAYFDELPEWVKIFNKDKGLNKLSYIHWQRAYPRSRRAYDFYHTQTYKYTRQKKGFLNRKLPIGPQADTENHYLNFIKTPQANQVLFDLAKKCIDEHVSRKSKDRLLLWVSLSPLDKLGHECGPYSIECIDMIYHLDKQLQKFIRYAHRAVGKNEVLFALTADHGVSPMPEILQDIGIKQAQRIKSEDIIKKINSHVEQTYNLSNSVLAYKSQQFFLNEPLFEKLESKQQKKICKNIRDFLKNDSSIKEAWTFNELVNACTEPNTVKSNMSKQLFLGRSGQVIVQTYPYTIITKWGEGASHKTPYESDTHVPLIIFQHGRLERRYVRKRVHTLQLANTFAELLHVPKPSASMQEVLPEIFDPELPY